MKRTILISYCLNCQRLFKLFIGLLILFPTFSQAAYTAIDITYFGTPSIVGIDPIVPGQSILIGFDRFPNGSIISTPYTVPQATSLFISDPLSTAFVSVGIRLGADDVAISKPSHPPGVGVVSGPNSLASEPNYPFNSTTEIEFLNTTYATGLYVSDGPTNDVSISFFDSTDSLITTINPPSSELRAFIGIYSDERISRILLSTSGNDDYYVDDLYYFAPSVPIPSAVWLFGSGLIGLIGFKRRSRKGHA